MKLKLSINNSISALFSVAILVLTYYSLAFYALAVLLLIIILYLGKEKFIIPLIIIVFLVLVSDFTESYRNYINGFLILLLCYFFAKNYKNSSNIFGLIPKEIIYFIMITFFSMLISSVFSKDISYTLLITSRQMLFFVLVYIFFFFLHEKNLMIHYINSLLIVGLILGIVILFEVSTKGIIAFSIQNNAFNQFGGLYSNPNALGLLLTVIIPLLLGKIFFNQKEKVIFQRLYYTLLAFFFIILFLTNSRASIGAVIISITYITWKIKPKVLKYIAVIFVVLVLIVVSLPVMSNYLSIYFRVERIFENTRTYIWDMSFEIIQNNLWVGVGPELFGSHIFKHLPVMLGSFEAHQIWWAKSGTSHNFFLFKFAETGLLGLISSIWLFVLFFKIALTAERKTKNIDANYYKLTICIGSIGAGLLGRSFLESTGLISNGWITRDLPFWIAFIILIHIHNKFSFNEIK
ncbi:MAG: hypothetical protein AUK34_13815 [Ignavibacteria bacterium CG2_30_36_16]|nr:O-antigen ligase family protein [Ignavibacteria bacterium]OIP55233.1 MAG: hypothetical protein AUK34_13815 [Ignavibacteria bacterium CG2_30_36_16]